MTKNEIGSIPTSKRKLHLDIIRGLALLGILLVNLKAFVNPVSEGFIQTSWPDQPLDRMVEWLVNFLFTSKFYVVYSLLFGAGFAMMMESAQQKGQRFGRVYVRRMLALCIFGLLHSHLIWTGDILFTYSIMGMVLVLLFRKTPVSRLPKWASFHIGFPLLMIVAVGWYSETARRVPELQKAMASSFDSFDQEMKAVAANSEVIQRAGSYADVVRQNAAEWQGTMGYSLAFSTVILGIFLIGSWLYRSGCLARPHDHRRTLQRLMIGSLLLGLPMSFHAAQASPGINLMVVDWKYAIYTICLLLGGVLQGLGYVAALALYAERVALLRLLVPAGQMPLTNYLAQSIFWTFMCYGYGLGLAEFLSSRTLQVALGVVFFVLQVACSHWWLARFSYGPVEYLWRFLTYLEKPKSRTTPLTEELLPGGFLKADSTSACLPEPGQ